MGERDDPLRAYMQLVEHVQQLQQSDMLAQLSAQLQWDEFVTHAVGEALTKAQQDLEEEENLHELPPRDHAEDRLVRQWKRLLGSNRLLLDPAMRREQGPKARGHIAASVASLELARRMEQRKAAQSAQWLQQV